MVADKGMGRNTRENRSREKKKEGGNRGIGLGVEEERGIGREEHIKQCSDV